MAMRNRKLKLLHSSFICFIRLPDFWKGLSKYKFSLPHDSKLDLILSGSDKTEKKRIVITHMEEMILFAKVILLWMNSFFS